MKLALALPALLLAAPALAAEPISGRWITEDGKALIEIGNCGASVCGRIARVIKPAPGRASTDINNPDARLRSRPMLGLAILTGFTASGSGWKGSIYDPEEGKTYRSVLQRNANGTLKVKGCILMFCRAQTWRPAR